MIILIAIFLISIISAFLMIAFRVWEIKTKQKELPEEIKSISHIPFRHIEKNMLYLIKHVVLGLVLVTVKYWFIFSTKAKKWLNEKWPKIHKAIKPKHSEGNGKKEMSFTKRAILESKFKIRRMKQKIREEIE